MADVERKDWRERAEALQLVRDKLSKTYGGSCLVTEHGRVPVCRDENEHKHDAHCFHAHLLIFPTAPDITGHAGSYFLRNQTFQTFEDAMEYASAFPEYVLVSPRVDKFSIFTGPLNLPRQLARSLVAHAMKQPGLADWRASPNWEGAIRAAEALRGDFEVRDAKR